MKQLLYTLLATTVMLSACQKDDAAATATQPRELTFNLSMDGLPITQTRAASADAKLTDFGFYLAGYHTEGSIESAVATAFPNVFDHDITDKQAAVPLVTYVANKFTLKTVKWALDDKTYLNFYGWSQNKAIPTTGITATTYGIIGYTKSEADKGYPWIDIRNPGNPADQTDIVGTRSPEMLNDAVMSAIDLDFRHLLTKLTFKAKSSSGATVAIDGVLLRYAAGKLYQKARYTFNSSLSTIGSYGAFAEPLSGDFALVSGKTLTSTGGAEIALGDALLIPQAMAQGDVKVVITYKISPNGTEAGVARTAELPLTALTLEQGKNYVYSIDIKATEIVIDPHPIVESWTIDTGTSNLPLVAGPKGDVLLLLDAYDKPYQHTNGKWYWLDRSGYNRHMELVDMNAANYNTEGRYYSFAGKKGIVPSLGTVTDMTLQVVTQQTGKIGGSVFLASPNPAATADNARQFALFIGDSGYASTYFETGSDKTEGVGRLVYTSTSWDEASKLSVWTAVSSNSPNQSRLFQNKTLAKEQSMSLANRLSKNGALQSVFAPFNYTGKIYYMKVTKAVTDHASILLANDDLRARFKIPSSLPGTLVGRFAGKLISKPVGNEIHYYYDKLLYANESDETRTDYTWGPTTGTTGATDIINGAANTYNMLNSSTYPAAYACIQRSPSGEWHLPAQSQLMAIWIARSQVKGFDTSSYYWCSRESSGYEAYQLWSMVGKMSVCPKSDPKRIRCVREQSF